MFKKGKAMQSWKTKAELSAINFLVDESDAVNPFISPSDEEDANEVLNLIEDERDEEIILYICSFVNRLSCVKEKSYINNTSNF